MVAGVSPGVASHAADRIKFVSVDAKVFFDFGIDVDADDFAEDDDTATGRGVFAGVDDLEQLALDVAGRLGDAGRADNFAGDGGEACELEFIDFGTDLGGGNIGSLCEGGGDDVDDEFAGLLDVAEGVFAVLGAGTMGGAEEDGGGIGADSAEEAEGGEIRNAVAVDGGNERYGAWHDESDHELVGIEQAVRCGIDGAHGGDRAKSSRHGSRITFRLAFEIFRSQGWET